MSTVKTAIYLDEQLLERVDRVAEEMAISRSRLFAIAMVAFLSQRKSKELLDTINQAYHQHPPTLQEVTYLTKMQNLYVCGLEGEDW